MQAKFWQEPCQDMSPRGIPRRKVEKNIKINHKQIRCEAVNCNTLADVEWNGDSREDGNAYRRPNKRVHWVRMYTAMNKKEKKNILKNFVRYEIFIVVRIWSS